MSRLSLKLIYENIMFREQMPQLDDVKIKKLVKFFKDAGISVEKEEFNVEDITPSQRDFDEVKVANIEADLDKNKIKKLDPIFVSRDDYMLDGHHRWKAVRNKFPGSVLSGYRVDELALGALELLNAFVETEMEE